MPKKKRRYRPPARPSGYYRLEEIRALIQAGAAYVNPDAALDAMREFGWETDDVLRAVSRLKPINFRKTDPSRVLPSLFLDFYQASMEGQTFYTHFYVSARGHLIINSFHRPGEHHG